MVPWRSHTFSTVVTFCLDFEPSGRCSKIGLLECVFDFPYVTGIFFLEEFMAGDLTAIASDDVFLRLLSCPDTKADEWCRE